MSNQVLLQHLAECAERAHEGPLDFGTVFHALGRDGRMVRALDAIGPGAMMVDSVPFRIDLE